MKKEVMSVGDQIKNTYVIAGVAWLGSAVFDLFDNIVCNFLTIILMAYALYMFFKVEKSSKEPKDEMAENNLMEARAITLVEMHILIAFLMIGVIAVTGFVSLDFLNWNQLIFSILAFLIGAINLLVGINFRNLEKDGLEEEE